MTTSNRSAPMPIPIRRSEEMARLLAIVYDDRVRWLAMATRLVGDRKAGEDVLQNACLGALVRANELRSPERFPWWFLRVLKNASIDFRRRSDAYQRVLGRFAHEAQTVRREADPPPEVCGCAGRAFLTLSPAYAAIIRRIDLDGSTIDQAAREAGISATNARVRLHRARALFVPGSSMRAADPPLTTVLLAGAKCEFLRESPVGISPVQPGESCNESKGRASSMRRMNPRSRGERKLS